ncbi:hypothetical protein JTB14_029265 [Gonioctena quinquepunctata]|nr:hypothetical protein JTB14_029265 [Gonioctena quinquepunctata]
MGTVEARTKDSKLLSFYMTLGNIFGLVPFMSDCCTSRIWILKSYYFVFWGLLLFWRICRLEQIISVSIASLIESYGAFLHLKYSCELCFMIISAFGIAKHGKHWKKLIDDTVKFDDVMRKKINFEEISFTIHCFLAVVFYGTFLAMRFFGFIFMIPEAHDLITAMVNLQDFVQLTQCVFITIVMYEICGLLKRRYHYLENIVNATLSSVRIADLRKELAETKRLYAFLYDIVKEFNTIFGFQTILMFTNSFLDVLYICNTVINRTYLDVGGIVRATYSLMYLEVILLEHCMHKGFVFPDNPNNSADLLSIKDMVDPSSNKA